MVHFFYYYDYFFFLKEVKVLFTVSPKEGRPPQRWSGEVRGSVAMASRLLAHTHKHTQSDSHM